MENAVKKTKAMYFAELREMVLAAVEDQAQQDELIEFIDKQIETLEKRKVAAEKKIDAIIPAENEMKEDTQNDSMVSDDNTE